MNRETLAVADLRTLAEAEDGIGLGQSSWRRYARARRRLRGDFLEDDFDPLYIRGDLAVSNTVEPYERSVLLMVAVHVLEVLATEAPR